MIYELLYEILYNGIFGAGYTLNAMQEFALIEICTFGSFAVALLVPCAVIGLGWKLIFGGNR